MDNYNIWYDTGTCADYSCAANYIKIKFVIDAGTDEGGWYSVNHARISGNERYQRGVTPNRRIKSKRKRSRRGIKKM